MAKKEIISLCINSEPCKDQYYLPLLFSPYPVSIHLKLIFSLCIGMLLILLGQFSKHTRLKTVDAWNKNHERIDSKYLNHVQLHHKKINTCPSKLYNGNCFK